MSSQMLKHPPTPCPLWASRTPAATQQTVVLGMPMLVGAGRMPRAAREAGATGAIWELGRLGAAVGKSRGGGFVCKAGHGGGRLGKPRGAAASLPPPLHPRMMLWGAFLLGLRVFSSAP